MSIMLVRTRMNKQALEIKTHQVGSVHLISEVPDRVNHVHPHAYEQESYEDETHQVVVAT